MADDTRDRPGSAPGKPTTGPDGSVPDLPSRGWVWMQDTAEGGGGRFDVRSDRIRVWLNRGATVVPNYPIHFGPSGRPPKPRHQFAEPAAAEHPADAPAAAEEAPPAAAEEPTTEQPADASSAGEPAAAEDLPPAAAEEPTTSEQPADVPGEADTTRKRRAR